MDRLSKPPLPPKLEIKVVGELTLRDDLDRDYFPKGPKTHLRRSAEHVRWVREEAPYKKRLYTGEVASCVGSPGYSPALCGTGKTCWNGLKGVYEDTQLLYDARITFALRVEDVTCKSCLSIGIRYIEQGRGDLFDFEVVGS